MDKIVEVFLHGSLGKTIGKNHWKINVQSPAEALYAINIMSKDSIRKFFLKPLNLYSRYKILVNDKEVPFSFDENFYRSNELLIKSEDFKRLDIIPVLEGAGLGWLSIVIGVVAFGFGGPMFAMAGLSLLAAGISSLLAKPPKMPDQRQISNPSSDPSALADSYLFGGPINVLNEGGPIPLGYGRLMVGSQVVMSSYDFKYIDIRDAGRRI